MDAKTLTLKRYEETTIELPSRGAMGLQMNVTVADPKIASVVKKDLSAEDVANRHLKPGDAIPAIWIVKAHNEGTTRIDFTERKPGVNAGDDLPLRTYEIFVK